jgi:outer membrane biosynthesis protein TonB
MKFQKFITLCLFFSIAASPVFSQETSGTPGSDVDQKPAVEETRVPEEVSGDNNLPEEKTGTDTVPVKPAEKIPEQKKKEKINESPKSGSVKKTAEEPETKSDKPAPAGEPQLLGIDEGNFKYSRIPETGINEVKAPVAARISNMEDTESEGPAGEQGTEEGGFLGMGKGTADVVAKGGIVLLILVIFVLYKSRMKGTGKRGPGRNVLNSYRK